MAIDLFRATYVPTIFLRNAELRAVDELPDNVKDSLTPIFWLKPIPNATHLTKAIEKIEDVFGEDRKYFLEIDPFYNVDDAKTRKPAHDEFENLIDAKDGNANWVKFFDDHPNAFPCLQVDYADADGARAQAAAFTEMERVFLVRFSFLHASGKNWLEIVDAICETQHTNFGFVIDVEWGNDILSRAEWADRIVKRIVQLRGDSIPIIMSGSSFPDNFVAYENGGEANVDERVVFNNLISNNNEARLIYGDWASSRSPSESGGGGHPIPPRIDLSTQNTWEIFRVRDEDGGFPAAAKAAMASKKYPSGVAIWATYVIAATAIDDPTGIKKNRDKNAITSPARAAATRINLHLYTQMNFGNFDPAPDTDDDFQE